MLFLLLHVVGNVAFLLLVRLARGQRFNYPLVGLSNYVTATLGAALALAWRRPPALVPLALLYGAVNGAQYQLTYLLMYRLFGAVGVAVTTSILRLAVVVPVLASVLIWSEWPSMPQAIGLVLAAAALPLLSATRSLGSAPLAGRRQRLGEVVLVGTTLLISGAGLLAAKAFAELSRPDQLPVYVAVAYALATLLSLVIWPRRAHFQAGGAPLTTSGAGLSLVLGVLIGLVNVGQLGALLRALAQVSGVIAFPIAAAGGLALTTVGARLFWQERVGLRPGIGIVLALLAAALSNTSVR